MKTPSIQLNQRKICKLLKLLVFGRGAIFKLEQLRQFAGRWWQVYCQALAGLRFWTPA